MSWLARRWLRPARRVRVGGEGAYGSVQEHQVDVLQSGDLERLVDLLLGGLEGEGASGNFGGEENLVAGDLVADLADCGAAAGLVLVDSCRVDLYIVSTSLSV